jgi:hypothetical protein
MRHGKEVKRKKRSWNKTSGLYTGEGVGDRNDTGTTFSQSLEQSLHRALAIANERHHEYATLEHLLLSLIDDRMRRR